MSDRLASLEARVAKLEVRSGVDPGDGWRLLAVGETIQTGDEFFQSGRWFATGDQGAQQRPHPDVPRRRKDTVRVDPGPGWRLLAVGEPILNGDEFYSKASKEWRPTKAAGQRQGGSMWDTPRRRRVDSAELEASGWLTAEERRALNGILGLNLSASSRTTVERLLNRGMPEVVLPKGFDRDRFGGPVIREADVCDALHTAGVTWKWKEKP